LRSNLICWHCYDLLSLIFWFEWLYSCHMGMVCSVQVLIHFVPSDTLNNSKIAGKYIVLLLHRAIWMCCSWCVSITQFLKIDYSFFFWPSVYINIYLDRAILLHNDYCASLNLFFVFHLVIDTIISVVKCINDQAYCLIYSKIIFILSLIMTKWSNCDLCLNLRFVLFSFICFAILWIWLLREITFLNVWYQHTLWLFLWII